MQIFLFAVAIQIILEDSGNLLLNFLNNECNYNLI